MNVKEKQIPAEVKTLYKFLTLSLIFLALAFASSVIPLTILKNAPIGEFLYVFAILFVFISVAFIFGFIYIYLFIEKRVKAKISPATIENDMPVYLKTIDSIMSLAPFILLFLVVMDLTMPQIIFEVLAFSFIVIMAGLLMVDFGTRTKYIVDKYISISRNS